MAAISRNCHNAALTAIKGFHITPFSGMDDAAAEALLTQRLRLRQPVTTTGFHG
ncbi:MAG: hypothetical protein R2857_04630 [Vampirovibrionales bacterium]